MRMTAASIMQETADKYRIHIRDLMGSSRRREYAWPRQEAMYRIYTECPHLSYPEAARRMGGRDHTTLIWGVKRHCERIGITYEEATAIRAGYTGETFFRLAIEAYGKAMEGARYAV